MLLKPVCSLQSDAAWLYSEASLAEKPNYAARPVSKAVKLRHLNNASCLRHTPGNAFADAAATSTNSLSHIWGCPRSPLRISHLSRCIQRIRALFFGKTVNTDVGTRKTGTGGKSIERAADTARAPHKQTPCQQNSHHISGASRGTTQKIIIKPYC